MHGRQVAFPPLRRQTVQDSAHELHQRGLARLIRATDHRCLVRQILERQAFPDAKPVDLNSFNSHVAILRSTLSLLERSFYCLDRKSTRLNSSHLGISYAV